MTDNLPVTAQLSTLSREISDLNDRLAPSRDDEIAKAIGFLIDAGLAYPSTIDITKAVSIYCYALAGLPAYGLKRAVEKLIKGEVSGVTLGFIPRPPEFAAIVRLESKNLVDHRTRQLETRRSLQETAEAHIDAQVSRTPEAVARVKALRESFMLQHADQKVAGGGRVEHEPDEERAEHWSKIDALPDAPALSAEQMAFRRRVKSMMGKTFPVEKPAVDDDVKW